LSALPPNWYRETIESGVSPELPGIYEWRIEGVGCYIGQYTRVRRPRRHYSRNLTRMFAGLPYRKSKPDGFRLIHHALADAIRKRRTVTLILLENQVSKVDRNHREQELIMERKAEAAAGGLRVLNSN